MKSTWKKVLFLLFLNFLMNSMRSGGKMSERNYHSIQMNLSGSFGAVGIITEE